MADPEAPAPAPKKRGRHTNHATLPTCPACDAYHEAVADLEQLRWHCFACNANGGVELTTDP